MAKKPVDHLICPMCEKHICKHSKPMMVKHQEKLIEAAFAKGVLKGLLGISKCVNEARAAQIAKLTSEDSIAKIIEATHTEPIYPFIRTLSEAEFKRSEKRQHDSVKAAIKKASECAPIPKNDTAVVTAGADVPEKPDQYGLKPFEKFKRKMDKIIKSEKALTCRQEVCYYGHCKHDMYLDYCKTCIQMTNHQLGECLKCKLKKR